ncbi:hypothetical protein IE53DRAFT_368358 [Violaceomyces palustris]|uniref:Uncharacterized protein n=1 Tax=Violaceomyces palustris TaxID=1673888 RepID=A0ACD0NZ67_9BASI|nr:hypothetical protein IE53DRAFT_368358 [Violaceomyces palustris]
MITHSPPTCYQGQLPHFGLQEKIPGYSFSPRALPPVLPARPRPSRPMQRPLPSVTTFQQTKDSGVVVSEPIDFRSRLDAFESRSSKSAAAQETASRAPLPTRPHALRSTDSMGSAPAPTQPIKKAPGDEQNWSEPRRAVHPGEADRSSPIPRSNSAPRIRQDLGSSLSKSLPSSRQNSDSSDRWGAQFEQASSSESAVRETARVGGHAATKSGSGIQMYTSRLAPNFEETRLRKSGSGTSLRELTANSLAGAPGSRNRSQSLASRSENGNGGGGSQVGSGANSSGRNSPRMGVKSIIALYGGQQASTVRTASPMSMGSTISHGSHHMLDASNDEGLSPLPGHNVLEPEPRPSSSTGLQSISTSQPSSPLRTAESTSYFTGFNLEASPLALRSSPQPQPQTLADSIKRNGFQSEPPQLPSRFTLQPPTPSKKRIGPPIASPSAVSQASSASDVKIAASTQIPSLPPRKGSGGNSKADSNSDQTFFAGSRQSLLASSPAQADRLPASSTPSVFGNISYAPYVPGSSRKSAALTGPSVKQPPALPPRISEKVKIEQVGLRAESSSKSDGPIPYAYRQRSLPGRVSPSPSAASRGGLSGKSAPPPPPPPPPPRPAATQSTFAVTANSSTNVATPSSGGSQVLVSRGRLHSHGKTPSTTFTSISLDDEASKELKMNLESAANHIGMASSGLGSSHKTPTLPRARALSSARVNLPSSAEGFSMPASQYLANSGGASSWQTAAATVALPPFRSEGASKAAGGFRSMAGGPPSKQSLVSARISPALNVDGGLSRSTVSTDEAPMPLRSGEGSGPGWAVTLDARSPTRLKSTLRARSPDAAARRRYEALFDESVAAQERASKEKVNLIVQGHPRRLGSARGEEKGYGDSHSGNFGAVPSAESSSTSLIEGEKDTAMKGPGPGVASLRGWFEQDSSAGSREPTGSGSASIVSATREAKESSDSRARSSLNPGLDLAETLRCPPVVLTARRVKRIWRKSKLPEKVLGEIWDSALDPSSSKLSSSTARGLNREQFVGAMAAIDAELSLRAERRRERSKATESKPDSKGRSILSSRDWSSATRLPGGGLGSLHQTAASRREVRVTSDSIASYANGDKTLGARRLPPRPSLPPSSSRERA